MRRAGRASSPYARSADHAVLIAHASPTQTERELRSVRAISYEAALWAEAAIVLRRELIRAQALVGRTWGAPAAQQDAKRFTGPGAISSLGRCSGWRLGSPPALSAPSGSGSTRPPSLNGTHRDGSRQADRGDDARTARAGKTGAGAHCASCKTKRMASKRGPSESHSSTFDKQNRLDGGLLSVRHRLFPRRFPLPPPVGPQGARSCAWTRPSSR